jgi:hypothetical protein
VTTTDTGAARAAADHYIDQLRRLTHGEDIDHDAAARDLAAALDGHATSASIAGIVAAGNATIEYYKLWTHRGAADAARMATLRLQNVYTAVDAALAPFDQADDLAAAEADLARIEAEAAQAMHDLEAAVTAVDVAKVMQLRGEVEVGYPGRIGEARQRLLRLQVAEAEAALAAAGTRLHRAEATVAEENAEVQRILAELEAARTKQTTAEQAAAYARGSRNALTERRSTLAAQLRDLSATHERDQQNRLRRIAGLPLNAERAGSPR